MSKADIAVKDLFVDCGYPMRANAIAASDTCRKAADTVVVVPDEGLFYRCAEHRGLIIGGKKGEVRYYVRLARS